MPDRLRHDVRLRALALGLGIVPPRTMHAPEEAALLTELAGASGRVVEIGVYEGSSAVQLCRVMRPEAELHLIDPFGESPGALPAGWAANGWATKRAVERARRRHDGPRVVWHVAFSHDAAQGWSTPIDLVFIDGDHLEPGVRQDWDDWHPHVRPGGHAVFHDARASQPDGRGLPGPTAVVDGLFRGPRAIPGWEIAHERGSAVAVRRLTSASA